MWGRAPLFCVLVSVMWCPSFLYTAVVLCRWPFDNFALQEASSSPPSLPPPSLAPTGAKEGAEQPYLDLFFNEGECEIVGQLGQAGWCGRFPSALASLNVLLL